MEYLLILCSCLWIYKNKNENNFFGKVFFEKKNAFYLAVICLVTQVILTTISKNNAYSTINALIILSNKEKILENNFC